MVSLKGHRRTVTGCQTAWRLGHALLVYPDYAHKVHSPVSMRWDKDLHLATEIEEALKDFKVEVVINLCVNANIMENAQPYIFCSLLFFLLCANANVTENSFSTFIPVENLAEAWFCLHKTVHILPFQSKAWSWGRRWWGWHECGFRQSPTWCGTARSWPRWWCNPPGPPCHPCQPSWLRGWWWSTSAPVEIRPITTGM